MIPRNSTLRLGPVLTLGWETRWYKIKYFPHLMLKYHKTLKNKTSILVSMSTERVIWPSPANSRYGWRKHTKKMTVMFATKGVALAATQLLEALKWEVRTLWLIPTSSGHTLWENHRASLYIPVSVLQAADTTTFLWDFFSFGLFYQLFEMGIVFNSIHTQYLAQGAECHRNTFLNYINYLQLPLGSRRILSV